MKLIDIIRVLSLPLLETLFFKKASQEVVRYFLTEIIKIVLVKVKFK